MRTTEKALLGVHQQTDNNFMATPTKSLLTTALSSWP